MSLKLWVLNERLLMGTTTYVLVEIRKNHFSEE